jgi:hypothetical protein
VPSGIQIRTGESSFLGSRSDGTIYGFAVQVRGCQPGYATAVHLLQSGVDTAVIALWLGHECIETTHGYQKADLKQKEKAIQKLAPAGQAAARFRADDSLPAFL